MHHPMSFAVVGHPRSGTTWASNWLTTGATLCLHDPLLTHSVDQLRELRLPRPWGISCTVLMFLPDELATLTRRIVVLQRPLAECNASLRRVGLDTLLPDAAQSADLSPARLRPGRFDALEIDHQGLFAAAVAERAWRHLLPGVAFDALRHAELCRYDIQPRFGAHPPDPEAVRSWAAKAAAAVQELRVPPR